MPKETEAITLENRAAVFAARLGTSEDRLRRHKFELSTLRKEGFFIEVNFRGSSLFTRSINWAELGIQGDEEDLRKNRMRTGSKYVINPARAEKVKSIETRLRQMHKNMTVDIAGHGRWLPWSRYEKFKEEWDRLTAELEEVKAEIVANLDNDRDKLAQEFTEIAHTAWKQITGQGYEWYILNHKVYDRDDFTDMVVAAAVASMPAAVRIEEDLQADYIPTILEGEEDIAADAARAAGIRDAILAQEMQGRILEEEHSQQIRRHQIENMEREAKIEAFRQAEMEHLREVWKKEKSPLEQVFMHLRNEAGQAAEEILASIKKNGFVRGKVAQRAAGLLEWYQLMSITDDYKLQAKLAALKNAIGTIGDRKDAPARSTEEIKAILEEIGTLAHQAETDLDSVSRFAFVEVDE